MNKKAIGIVVVIIAAILLIVAFRTEKTTTSHEPIKIGSISALTGVGAATGEEEEKGAQLAVKEINASGGVNGRQLQLISDDLSLDKLKNAGSVAHRLFDVESVVAVVGPQWDEPITAVLPIAEKAKVPLIGPDSTDAPEANGGGDYLFSTWYDHRVAINTLLNFAQTKGWKKIAIIRAIDAGFWKFASDLVVKGAPSHSIQIVSDVTVNNPLVMDWRTFITKVKSDKPDALFVVSSDPTECPFFKQLKEQNFSVPVLATESAGNVPSLTQCPNELTNLYFATPKHYENYSRFEQRFVEEYGRAPLFPSAVTAYDAIKVLAVALEKTNGNGGEALQKALSQTKDVVGASQPTVTFKQNGFVVTPDDAFEVQTVRGGKFVKAE